MRSIIALALLLAACTTAPSPRPTTAVAQPPLSGRWAVAAVAGTPVDLRQMHVDFAPLRGSAFLGCNEMRFGGWSQKGDELQPIFPIGITERGCPAAGVEEREEWAFRILRRPMTVERNSRWQVRLRNEAGAIDLVQLSDKPEVSPLLATDRLDGRWRIARVNDRVLSGPTLEFAGQSASWNLACNSGGGILSRNGDKLAIDQAMLTERGCGAGREAIDSSIIAILRQGITVEITSPDGLRLINNEGTLDLQRQ